MNVKNMTIAAIISSGIMVSAQAANLVGVDQSGFTQLCVTAAEGNRAAMYNEINFSGYSRSFVVNNVKCNGQSIMIFIQNYGKNNKAMNDFLDHSSSNVSIIDL